MRMVDADSLLELVWRSSRSAIQDAIQNAPTIEYEPVRYGQWEKGHDVFGNFYKCTVCDATFADIGYGYNYCPECGARMDEWVSKNETN